MSDSPRILMTILLVFAIFHAAEVVHALLGPGEARAFALLAGFGTYAAMVNWWVRKGV